MNFFVKNNTIYPLAGDQSTIFKFGDGTEHTVTLCDNLPYEDIAILATALDQDWSKKQEIHDHATRGSGYRPMPLNRPHLHTRLFRVTSN